ncbi:MAG TPA: substrate-binding domain-containing protein, partial [Candidatus Goldiibacteriota bacterium]|nr:substrate-binding domain-containing protein [Candidatus Goldiibacteriota bacterium]
IHPVLIENSMACAYSVNTDNRKAGYIAAEYLIKSGRKRIGLISGGIMKGSAHGYSYSAAGRKAGFIAAFEAAGLKAREKTMITAGQYTIEEGMNLFGTLTEKEEKIDAVFCASGDMTALGVMEAAKKRGMKVPDDLAVIGFDDMQTSEFLNPPLTTVRQNIDKIGAAALDISVAAIEKSAVPARNVVIEPELVIRKSA